MGLGVWALYFPYPHRFQLFLLRVVVDEKVMQTIFNEYSNWLVAIARNRAREFNLILARSEFVIDFGWNNLQTTTTLSKERVWGEEKEKLKIKFLRWKVFVYAALNFLTRFLCNFIFFYFSSGVAIKSSRWVTRRFVLVYFLLIKLKQRRTGMPRSRVVVRRRVHHSISVFLSGFMS